MFLHGVKFDFALHSTDLIIVLSGARCTSALSVPSLDNPLYALVVSSVAGFVMPGVSPEYRDSPV